MIDVVLSPQCERLIQFVGITQEEVTTTVNDRHRGMIMPGLDRISAVHWFSEDRIVFVEGTVTHKDLLNRDNRVYLKEVCAELAIELRPELPAGQVRKGMAMRDILPVIAKSFGQPVTCHPDLPPTALYFGAWDGKTVNVESEQRSTECLLIGTFDPHNKTADWVWAFDLERYRDWLGRPTASVDQLKGIVQEGTLTFSLKHSDPDWPTNAHEYRFEKIETGDICVETTKHGDGTIELVASGPLDGQFLFRHPIPESGAKHLFVAITWKYPEVSVFLNGTLAETKSIG